MIFAVFFGIFPESWISAQKQDTRAILLKTALVHVSCIQNTQIRGETTSKVFGKVDTFWTYQSSLLKMCSLFLHYHPLHRLHFLHSTPLALDQFVDATYLPV
jgi:hypothetical protein